MSAPDSFDIALRPAEMHLCKPTEPAEVVVVKNELCTAGRKAAGWVRHIELDLSGTPLAGRCIPGQSLGVLPPGTDDKGRPHKPRLYSLASPTRGEDGQGNVHSLTVKRLIDENLVDNSLFLGVASNHLCSLRPGDKVRVSGPSGKRFVLPQHPDQHDYVFIATGTGIAPFRGMLLDLLAQPTTCRIVLIMGSPYSTDLLYDAQLRALAKAHPNFSYLTAISRENNGPGGVDGKLYVQDRLRTHRDLLAPMLASGRALIYICGIAGMELGIFQHMARTLPPDVLAYYLAIDPDAQHAIETWERAMIHRQVRPTRRVFLEVYA
jgi:ferredoxin--NADP+ reductase